MIATTLTLSQAMRHGALLREQADGALFQIVWGTPDDAETAAHGTPPLEGRSDALGAVYEALDPDAVEALLETLEPCEELPTDAVITIMTTLRATYPDLKRQELCPICKGHRPLGLLYEAVMHLNDIHRWSREQVADYLEGLGL